MSCLITVFGEAEKGRFAYPYLCTSLFQLADLLGEPPRDSKGLPFAIQMLLYRHDLLFFRVEEEGFSVSDYLKGLKYLTSKEVPATALALPGVGDKTIINACDALCQKQKTLLIISEKDLFDYLTSG